MALKRKFDSLTPLVVKWRYLPRNLRAKAVKLLMAVGALVATASQKRAPVLTGALENSHKVVVTRRESTRVTVEVQVGGGAVDGYIELMHEGTYGLGPRSRAKQAADPSVVIGPKFLERGLASVEDVAVKEILDKLFGEIS